ncbi:fatty acyl-CoA reductase 2-like isoform X2 [Fopius arisanus]|uniref:Fatty acyl-CoA reductase n=1 Tax=Fopius arisanus TaxID=64838 RepID=A0A9R1U5J0_9HYME|nr:PREDICTED: fatty acyl-CoA reductase 2-like isoform X2 [Fopius arisanus]
MSAQKLSVVGFYEDKKIFITGGTGGIGKLLLEKLLRCCPKIGCIYLLVRPKKGKTSAQRLSDLLDSPVLLHVSTLYSTCHKVTVDECIPVIPTINGSMDFNQNKDDFLKTIPLEVAKKWPNTYTFSKALTEVMLDNLKGRVPVSIVRPSIILSTWKDPIPGWVDNFHGPTLTVVNGALGIIRSVVADGKKIGDVIPSDMVVNLLICVAHKTKYQDTEEIRVYNICSGRQNPLTVKFFLKESQILSTMYPSKAAIRYPNWRFTPSELTHKLRSAVHHHLVAYIFDLVAFCTFKKSRLSRIHRSVSRIAKTTKFFSLREWIVCDRNVEILNEELSDKDREVFEFDVKKINWKAWLKDYILGIRKHLLKEDLDNLDEAIARMKKLYWVENIVQSSIPIVAFFIIYFMIKRSRRRH